MVFQYSGADQEFGRIQAKELVSHLEVLLRPFFAECQVSSAEGYVEVGIRGVDKGQALTQILDRIYRSSGKVDFVLIIGDDISDERMFKQLSYALEDRN
jgi:trehalose 6-phosphate synthase/phosphatase